MVNLCKDCKFCEFRENNRWTSDRYWCVKHLSKAVNLVTGETTTVGRTRCADERGVEDEAHCSEEGKFWEPRTAEQLIEDKRRRDEWEELERKIKENEDLRSRGFWGFFGGR
jgi:hypothetical protein